MPKCFACQLLSSFLIAAITSRLRGGASIADTHAIASATIASIFLEVFSFAMRQPRAFSTATVLSPALGVPRMGTTAGCDH